MAIRMRTKWHTRGPKSIEDRAGVVGFNIWKISNEAWKHMEKEGFRVGDDRQVVALIIELLAFLMQISDRLVYGQLSEEERARFMNALGQHLAKTVYSNMLDMFGPGDYTGPFIATLNERLADYSEFEFAGHQPSYAMLRYLGDKMAAAMTGTDSKWVVEQVIDIEAPEAVGRIKKLVHEVLGIQMS
ncbi:MAG TPA: hypothetical protein DIC36_05510 [Gammaproteobacteria bacterium]|nr:hypothetical protein [Gammaproteobacteria bacterium]